MDLVLQRFLLTWKNVAVTKMLGALRKRKKIELTQDEVSKRRQMFEASSYPFGAVANIKRTPNFSSNISKGMGFRKPNFKFSFDDVI